MSDCQKCYIYTRVSTEMQVEGYSLDDQRNKLSKYADLQSLEIAGFYSDEGKSGKSISGRPAFSEMMKDIQLRKDNISFVLVTKLSRFGRKASDILTSFETLQEYDCELVCVDDGINTAHGAGKMMIAILAAFAEIERENIRAQSFAGRQQKAREGLWNGGVPPYGYITNSGKLEIVEDEAEVVRKIFDLYTTTSLGTAKIAEYLNDNGYKKTSKRPNDNRELSFYTAHFISLILDNPTYAGMLSYGRTKTEKVKGSKDDYHRVKSSDYILVEGQHQAIICKDLFYKAQEKKQYYVERSRKMYDSDHINLLSGIIKCPVCGKGMYGNVSRKKRGDGSLYKDIYYYYCKHSRGECSFARNLNQEKINTAVVQVISTLVAQDRFSKAIAEKIKKSVSTEEVQKELDTLNVAFRKKQSVAKRLGREIDELDFEDATYSWKYDDLQHRQNSVFEEIAELDAKIQIAQKRLEGIKRKQLTQESVLQFLQYFDKLYDKFEETEKREFLHSFISEIQVYADKQPSGQILKEIKFNFPVILLEDGTATDVLSLESKTDVETVVLLVRKTPDAYVRIKMDMEDFDLTKPETKATYEEIKAYILEQYGVKVSSLYIAQVKEKLGIKERENYNFSKDADAKQPQCPKDKERLIVEALKHFKMI